MIVSASRRTDIPRWYAPWLMNRLRAGEVLVGEPYRPHRLRRYALTPEGVDAVVFWTKDPRPLLPHLDEIKAMGYRSLLQFTLTPYGADIEPGLEDKGEILAAFQALGRRLGRERVLWRYDPVLLTGAIGADWHRERFRALCERLSPYTDQVTLSFLDSYPGRPMDGLRAPDHREAAELAAYFGETARAFGLSAVMCCEAGDYTRYGIGRAACIDRERLERVCGGPLELKPDRGQRPGCGCCESVDIGAYDTCPTGCRYCYANRSPGRTAAGWARHAPDSPLLVGFPGPEDEIIDADCVSARASQLRLF